MYIDIAKTYLLGDSSIDIWYDDFVVIAPQVDIWRAATGALVLRRHRERDLILAFLEIQFRLENKY